MSRNKKPITKRRRTILLAVAGLVIALSGYAVYYIHQQDPEDETRVLYQYAMTAKGDYQVQLKENALYSETILPAGGVYPKSIFDKLLISLNAELIGIQKEESEPAEVSCTYVIKTAARGLQQSDGVKRTIYEKEFIIRSQEDPLPLQSTGGTISEELELNFDALEAYTSHAESIIRATAGKEAELIFSGAFTVKQGDEEKTETFDYRLPIPIFTDLFQITQPDPIGKSGEISVQEEGIRLGFNPLMIAPIALIVASLGLILALLQLFDPKLVDEAMLRRNAFKQILRRHGSRMVQLEGGEQFAGTLRAIADMDSMVKLSDQLGVPMLYALEENGALAQDRILIPHQELLYVHTVRPKGIYAHGGNSDTPKE